MPNRIPVLWLIKGLGLGGAEQLLVNAAPYLDRKTFDYQIGYFLPWKDALVPEFKRQGFPVTCFGVGHPLGFGSMPSICRYLREKETCVLHAHLPWSSIIGRLAARRCGVPAILYTEHGCWERLNPISRMCNRATLGWNDLTIAVSEEVRASMKGIDSGNVTTIANGIDCEGILATTDDRESVFEEFNIPSDNLLIVCVANLTRVKNHELLVRAFGKLVRSRSDTSLILVGQLRETTEAVRCLIATLGLERQVVVTGPRTDVPRIVNAADVFALSSHSEGLPVSLLEAMALAKPVVCTNVGGIPGVVTDGWEGFLVPPNEPDALADRLTRLFDPDLRMRLGQAGQDKVRKSCDVSTMVQSVEAEYRRILEGKGHFA